MIYFIIAGVILCLILKRNLLTIVNSVTTFKMPYLLISTFTFQILIYWLSNRTQRSYPILLELSFAVMILGLWMNRHLPGIIFICFGALLNLISIIVHGGLMPVSEKAMIISGINASHLDAPRHQLMNTSNFWWLGDWIPFIRHVISIGDVSVGFGFILFLLGITLKRDKHEG
ncbi:DUF5317 family protein [Paenibacillus sp. GP183]|jgi:hypothetical protein|uniref:DUF5317 family protein n=1 Tax=Paenibacillus sp. GP183 TaxID=1882751 RepID=UPI0008952C00|nr:DUF5317 family protein [Paenibacillus sp. GP183]SEB75364.1 hypothetical protein SAMN05443246_1799 [Paenibacillus sp. GP183]